MKLESVVLAVKDLEVSKNFYIRLFDQKVVLDHGLNISFMVDFLCKRILHGL